MASTAITASSKPSAPAVPELTLVETLRVLEVARGMQRERTVAEQALARSELRQVLRQRLLDTAAVTGDQVTEADIDAAIDQYFARLHRYQDPPMSVTVVLAHLYVRRLQLAVLAAIILVGIFFWQFLV